MSIKDLESKIERYEGLIKLAQLTSSSMDYETIQRKSEIKIKKLLNCEAIYIYKFANDTKTLQREFKADAKSEVVDVPVSENTFIGSCAHFGAVLHFKNPKDDIRFKKLPNHLQNMNPKNLLFIPLLSNGEILGVIEAVNSMQEDFNDEDIHFAEAIANQLTMSLVNYKLFNELQGQFVQVVEALADAIGKKDSYTGGHTKRVMHFSSMIGKALDLPFEDMNNLMLAAVLHDIGKIGIEDSILKKDSELTEEEFVIMKKHPKLGFEILGHIESLKVVVDGMKFHHERPDGTGYPFGLKGDEIPLIASIISVADTFDAMISTRPYRKGLPPMVAWEEILNNSGTQFATKVVDGFDKAFRKTKMYRPKKLKNVG